MKKKQSRETENEIIQHPYSCSYTGAIKLKHVYGVKDYLYQTVGPVEVES